MTDYTNLLERLAVSAGDQECLYADAKAAIEALQTRVAESEDTNKALRVRLGSELERANELVADLQAECSELRGMAGAMDIFRSEMIDSGVIDINVPPMFFSESIIPRLLRLADMEKQEPVAHARKWFIDGEEPKKERKENGRMVWPFKFKLVPVSEGKLLRDDVPLYAAPPVITQHEPVTTVEDRYNDDGKSCHITDDLPAGMKLYADPPVAAPVRLTDKNIDRALSERVPGGSEVRDWFLPHDTDRGHANILTVVRAIETFVLRANGFKVEGEQ